jgi:ribonucleoside-triphosphate reductase
VYTHQCNLSEINLPAFNGNLAALEDAAHRLGRANYRQTCVDLRDGVLQPTWHQTNETLRLCGVGITGITMCPWLTPYILRRIRQAAWAGACSVANEYGTPRPAAVTTVKPSGTLSKVFGVSSGCHQPVSRYELNTILFDRHDPLVASLRGAGFQMFEHPTQENGMLIEFPIDNGSEVVENEPAIVQLERYRMLMDNWCDYNVSITVSYDHHEIPAIVDWLDRNWDSFVAVSWMQRIDPWTDPASINQRYLPQRALTPAEFSAKAKDIRPINWNQITETDVQYDIEDAAECAGGACPVR